MAGGGGYTIAGGTTSRWHRRHCIIGIIIALVLIAIVAIIVAVTVKKKSKQEEKIIIAGLQRRISCGKLKGSQLSLKDGSKIFAFKGIPYAAPPVGHLRWKPPKSLPANASCWTGMFDATKYGNTCAQYSLKTATVIGQEDCLYLNVWTSSANDSANLPVAVYIHGGTLLTGSGKRDGIEDFVKTGIVAVTMNYRLNAFGFLTLDVLSEHSSSAITSNFGFVDQIEALKWVRANIKVFGGNPQQVTIIGFSAGAKSVQALLASPLANGYFHGAVLLSGTPVFYKSQFEAAKENLVFIERAGCNKTTNAEIIKCLYALSTDEIIKSIPWVEYPSWGYRIFRTLPTKDQVCGALGVIDKVVVPTSPLRLRNVKFAINRTIPVMIGSTAHEMETTYIKARSDGLQHMKRLLNSTIGTFGPDLVRRVLQVYGRFLRNVSYIQKVVTIATDARVTCQTNVYAKNLSLSSKHVAYHYIVTNEPSNPVRMYDNCCYYLSFHGWINFAIFGFPPTPKNPFKASQRDLAFKVRIQHDLEHFIKHGTPVEITWKPVPDSYADYGPQSFTVITDGMYHQEACQLLMDNGLYPYGWAI